MELVLTLAVLYVWQCSIRIGEGEVLLVRGLRPWGPVRGPGRWLAHPWPSALSVLTQENADPRSAAFDPRSFEATLESARRGTRWLGRLCDAYLLLCLVMTPLAIAIYSAEFVLTRVLPGVALLHLGGLILLDRSGRRVGDAPGADHWEWLATCALYPPALLRAPQDLVRSAVAGFHPMAACAVLLGRPQFQQRASQTLARLRSPRWGSCLGSEAEALRQAVVGIARGLGISEQDLVRPRPRIDPNASSYCESCLCDYRPASIVCHDCGIRTLAYREVQPGGPSGEDRARSGSA